MRDLTVVNFLNMFAEIILLSLHEIVLLLLLLLTSAPDSESGGSRVSFYRALELVPLCTSRTTAAAPLVIVVVATRRQYRKFQSGFTWKICMESHN